jgi:5-oxoprolinase (ATP-hydrolysing)
MYSFSIDRGGTFTDIGCQHPCGRTTLLKLLSSDPAHYADAPTEGVRRLLEQHTGEPHPRGAPIPTRRIASIRMGTTVATNALLERRGSPTCLVVSAGLRDVLAIGTQARPRIFDLAVARPEPLYQEVVEVDARVLLAAGGAGGAALPPRYASLPRATGAAGEELLIERGVDEAEVRRALAAVRARGVTSCAIALLHSYTYGEHERTVARLARECGFTQVSMSHELMPTVKLVPRGHTACADAYLTPVISAYLASFAQGFEGGLGLGGAPAAAAQRDRKSVV